MTEKLFRMCRSGISLLLAVCMIIGMIPCVAFGAEATDEEVIHYVSLGASNTNGYGLDGYLPDNVYEDPLAASKANLNVYGYLRTPAAAYPAKIAASLKAESGKDVALHQLAISSMRVEEVRYLLDDSMEPDAYMNWRFTGGQQWFAIAEPGGVPALRKAYRDYITAADVVTVDLGWNNFGVFAFNQIKTILSDGRLWKDIQIEDYMDSDDAQTYQKIKALVLEKLSSGISDLDSDLLGKLELMTDVLTAATMGACHNYDIVMEKIYELNPDVTVVVINIQNLADDLVIDLDGAELPLGDIYGELIDLVNLYRATESPYADKTLFADTGDVTTFLDEILVWNGDPTTLTGDMEDCFDMYDDSLFVRSIVEYMLVGQALSGLFDGFRKMAAQYGLEGVFANDDQYTYEFALTRSVEDLLSLDLSALDFANPGGSDQDIEEYGAAVSKHIKNLREETKNLEAYNYVFENLMAALQNQKAELEATLANLPEGTPQEVIDELNAGIAQLTQAIEMIIPAAKAEFDSKLNGVYNTYINTLNYAYDVVATIFKSAAEIDTLRVNADTLNGFDSAADVLMDYVVDSFLNGGMQKFYYELQKNNVQETGITEDPVFAMDETLLEDPAVAAVGVLAVRYELGNSFFAHPSPKGHDEITATVMDALKNGSHVDDFTDAKLRQLINLLKSRYPELYEKIVDAGLVGEMDGLAAFEAAYIRATTDNYVIRDDSMLVAIGDASAVSASYVDKLASELEIEFTNLATVADEKKGTTGTIHDAYQVIADNAETIAQADLITVGYGNNTFTSEAIKQVIAKAFNGTPVTYDWSEFVGEEGVAYVEELLAKVNAFLVDNGMSEKLPMSDMTMADTLTSIAEAYAYSAVSYACYLPEVVNAIHSVNPDAVVVIAGMNNSFAGATLTMDDTVLPVGDYVKYLVDGANLHGIIYAMLSDNCIYVAAPDAETDLTNGEFSVIDFVLNYGRNVSGNPTEAGHEYIKDQILDALDISHYVPRAEGLFRLKGKNRYLTGLAIANELKAVLGVEKFSTVVVAYGEKFPDALTGSYLAAIHDAPILLTDKSVDNDVVNYIRQNLVQGGKVYILGGTAAVTQAFEDSVKSHGFDVERLKGKNRYETNLAILSEAGVDTDTEILIATGANYADSLSASATGLPMLLVDKELTADQVSFLEGTSKKFAILGGTAAVSAEIEAALAKIGTVERVKGKSRYETSVVIAQRYFENPEAIVLAYGEAFPDGLCGGPLAIQVGAPLILTHNDKHAAADEYVQAVASGYVTGGTARLSDETVREIFDVDATTEIVVKE